MSEKGTTEQATGTISKGSFKNNIGIEIFYKVWEPVESPKAHVVFVHGHGEHTSRYDKVFSIFSESGIKVLAFDQVGCGETGRKVDDVGGARGLDQVLLDISLAIENIHQVDVPLFLMGHSFGGCAILNYLVRGSKRQLLHGAISSAPCIKVAKESLPHVLVRGLIKPLALLFPRLKVKAKVGMCNDCILCSFLDPSALSRKQEEAELYLKDPLVFSKCALIQIRDVIFGGQDLMNKGYKSISVSNLFLVHGSADRITSYETTLLFASKLKALNMISCLEFKSYEGFFHELHFDIGSEEVITNYVKWINSKLAKSAVPEI